METTIHEIADGIYRLSTFIPDVGLPFNQYLVDADEPLLFHTGPRALFPLVSDAVGKITPVERLRRIAFGHFEADECGSMNEFLAAAPNAVVAHTVMGCLTSIADQADREPEMLAHDQVIDLGGKRIRNIDTPHVPHGWDAHVMYEETTGTLLCGDLFTQLGECPALVHDGDIVGPALAAEDMFGATALTATTADTIRSLTTLAPRTLALMHGPAFAGDCVVAITDLAEDYARRAAGAAVSVVR